MSKLEEIQKSLELFKEILGSEDGLEKGRSTWSYNQGSGNFNHPLHGSVTVRQKDSESKPGLEVVHNGKIISSHGPDDKAGAMKSATKHMKYLSNLAPVRMKKSLEKDELDEKIKAKLRAEMDKRKFGEADATRHIIDRDRGDKMPKPPKEPKPLLQSEMDKEETEKCSYSKSGQWKLEKDNSVKPFGQSVYNSTANLNRKENRTGEVREGVGRNNAVHRYTTSGSSMSAAHEKAQAKAMKQKSKESLKVYSKEEIAEMNAKLKDTKKGEE